MQIKKLIYILIYKFFFINKKLNKLIKNILRMSQIIYISIKKFL